ncbi:MAG: HD domain-containing protein [Desulfovibrionaceae bacterium]|nr:HD domain-containing protein [Desulfovibrionaceae bacterium]
MDLDRHITAFTDFADGHLTGEKSRDYYILLKREHSLRVLDNGREIVENETVPAHEAELAILASLYHDIGRFPQFARYGTYKDADSLNHGRMGVLAMRTLDLPDDVAEAEWRLIRATVGLHNAKSINPATRGCLRTMVNVVRDADKIDIFNVILDHLGDRDNPRKEVILSLEEHPTRYSGHVYEAVLSGLPCDYRTLRYSNDFILMLIGWIRDLSYETSKTLLYRRGLVDKAFFLLPADDRIKALEDRAHAYLSA